MRKMKTKKKIFILISAILITLMITPCFADIAGNNLNQNQDHSNGNPFLFPIHLYRKHISSSGGDRCPMYPSCSTYSLEAFEKHGVIKGWIMTCDRLMRCGRDELRLGSPVIIRGKTRTYDSINNNDFWWNKSGEP
jgi:putative membrane protein insertion efficiency factor